MNATVGSAAMRRTVTPSCRSVPTRSGYTCSHISTSPVASAFAAVCESGMIIHSTRSTFTTRAAGQPVRRLAARDVVTELLEHDAMARFALARDIAERTGADRRGDRHRGIPLRIRLAHDPRHRRARPGQHELHQAEALVSAPA